MLASKAPMNHGLVRLRRTISQAPARVMPASHSRPGHSVTRPALCRLVSTCKPQWPFAHCMAKGTESTTIIIRTLWAAATRSVRAPMRSASRVISEAPPMAPAK